MSPVAKKKTAKRAKAKKKAAKKPAAKKKVAKKRASAPKTARKKKAAGSTAKKKKPAKTTKPKSKAVAKKPVAKKPAAPKPALLRRKKKKKKTVPKRRTPRLTPKQVGHFRQLLLEKQEQLTHAYHVSKGDSQSDLDDGTEDYIDYAVHSYAKEFLLSLTELERKQLFLVEEALERVGGPDYGSCASCGQVINVKRLEVAPWARYCVPCQELEEKGLLPAAGFADQKDEDDDEEETYEGELDLDEDQEEAEEKSDDALTVKQDA